MKNIILYRSDFKNDELWAGVVSSLAPLEDPGKIDTIDMNVSGFLMEDPEGRVRVRHGRPL